MADFIAPPTTAKPERAFLIGVQTQKMPPGEGNELLLELQELVENLQLTVVNSALVNLRVPVSATLLGFASHSPGGLGVFDAAMLVGLWQMDREELLAGMLLFRALTRAPIDAGYTTRLSRLALSDSPDPTEG